MNKMQGAKGPTRVSQGINVTAKFIEDAEGKVLNGFRVSDMRGLAQQIFHQMLQCNVASAQWGKISQDSLMYFLSEMYSSFPELCLCNGHWKANRLASQQYSGWYRNNVTKKIVKIEDPTEPRSKPSKKRPALTISTHVAKKARPLPTPVRSTLPIRSPSPEDFEYLDAPDLPASVLDNPWPIDGPTEKTIDPPTPISLPTPVLAQKDHPEMFNALAPEIIVPPTMPAEPPKVTIPPTMPAEVPAVIIPPTMLESRSPLNLLADASRTVSASEKTGISTTETSDQLAISNPLHDVFGAPAENFDRPMTGVNNGTTNAIGKGKKKTSAEEKDTTIYPAKTSNSIRNLYLIKFYADFKKKHPTDKLMKSVFDAAFDKLTMEDLAVCRCFPQEYFADDITKYYKTQSDKCKKAAKGAKSSALAAS